jgi:SAM-dependent methyltransferase
MSEPSRPTPEPEPRTQQAAYARRLQGLEAIWWKRVLDVQWPYRRHLRGLSLGWVLDIGCGLGRNLQHLGGHGVGVDHNAAAVEAARARGLRAYLPEEFRASPHARPSGFDTLLLSHVVEHMRFEEARALLAEYLRHLRPGGKVVLITPQEMGFRSDTTHVEFFDLDALARLAAALALQVEERYSFPFPRVVVHLFKYNEFVLLARKPLSS